MIHRFDSITISIIAIVTFRSCYGFMNVNKWSLNGIKYIVDRTGMISNTVNSPISMSSKAQTTELSVPEIAARLKFTQYGQSGDILVEANDRTVLTKNVKIRLSRKGGLGLDLLEFDTGKGKTGLVLVGDILPGSNAEKCGLFKPGDALSQISSVVSGNEVPVIGKLEGLNFDETVNVLSNFSEYDEVEIVVKRLVKRGEIIVQIVGPQGKQTVIV